jgi:fluoride ion exporter CrcB/FEX
MELEPIIILLLIGAFGGIIRCILGYTTQADPGESFNYIKAIQTVLRAALVGSFIVWSTIQLTGEPVTTAVYVLAFFTAIGADVLSKEGYSASTKPK